MMTSDAVVFGICKQEWGFRVK